MIHVCAPQLIAARGGARNTFLHELIAYVAFIGDFVPFVKYDRAEETRHTQQHADCFHRAAVRAWAGAGELAFCGCVRRRGESGDRAESNDLMGTRKQVACWQQTTGRDAYLQAKCVYR